MRGSVAVLFWLGCSTLAIAAETSVPVRWADLPTYVNGMTISTVLTDGCHLEGRAISVEPEWLVMMVRKSSDRTRFEGKAQVPRALLSIMRVGHTGWKWKVVGPIVGFFAMGALGTGVGAAVDRGGFILSDGAAIGMLAGMATGVVGGALVGRWADHHSVTVKIVP